MRGGASRVWHRDRRVAGGRHPDGAPADRHQPTWFGRSQGVAKLRQLTRGPSGDPSHGLRKAGAATINNFFSRVAGGIPKASSSSTDELWARQGMAAAWLRLLVRHVELLGKCRWPSPAASARPTRRPGLQHHPNRRQYVSGPAFTSYQASWGQSIEHRDNLRALDSASSRRSSRATTPTSAWADPFCATGLWFYANHAGHRTLPDQENLYDNSHEEPIMPSARMRMMCATPLPRRLNAVRLTWQATQKNKVGFFIDYTKNCSAAYKTGGSQCREPGDTGGVGPGVTPGTATSVPRRSRGPIWDAPAKIMQTTWTFTALESPALRERLFGLLYRQRRSRPFGVTDRLHSGDGAVHRRRAAFLRISSIAASIRRPSSFQKHATWKAAMSYITGQPQQKWGYQARVHVEYQHYLRRTPDQLPVSTTARRIRCRSA